MNKDPRINIIPERLKDIKRIIAISSAKGGVGKSLVSSTLGLLLAEKYKVGLLDLDFYGPSSHIILGAGAVYPKEEKGIIPPEIHGIKLMSIEYYIRDKPLPLRGENITDALIEILAITRWGPLEYLIIDLPPGIGEETLDIIRLVKGCKFIVVTTQSRISWDVVRRLIILLKEIDVPVLGMIENMRIVDKEKSGAFNAGFIEKNVRKMGLKYLGGISFDTGIENAIGNPSSLMKTKFAKELKRICDSTVQSVRWTRR